MINYEKFELANGLKVLVHHEPSTPIVAFNVLFDVGARDENPQKTGFAHLFEHFMFGGSVNIPKYDTPLEEAGGENNAFTNNDITNYYLTIPKENLETAFWLESDRMLNLAFTEKNLDVQKQVVIEEYKQSYLNQPYGDVWLLLRPMMFKVHPYRWPTIGKDIRHIEEATMQDVKSFYHQFYNPNNAILTVAGDVKLSDIKRLAEKWYGPIQSPEKHKRNIPKEPDQKGKRILNVERKVPVSAIYKGFHMCSRLHDDYYASDLLSDLLSNGNSSRFVQNLIRKQKIFSSIDAYITGERDNGTFIISGKPLKGTGIEAADKAIMQELDQLINMGCTEQELDKVKNKIEASFIYGQVDVLNKAMNLAYYELLGDANMINTEIEKYRAVTLNDIQRVAEQIFSEQNSATLYYHASA